VAEVGACSEQVFNGRQICHNVFLFGCYYPACK
jgi:hypothetical protein